MEIEGYQGKWYQKKIYKIGLIIPDLADLSAVDGEYLQGNFTVLPTIVQQQLYNLKFESIENLVKKDFETNAIALEKFVEKSLDIAEEQGEIKDINRDFFIALGSPHETKLTADNLKSERAGQFRALFILMIIKNFFAGLMKLHDVTRNSSLSFDLPTMDVNTEYLFNCLGIHHSENLPKMALGMLTEDLGFTLEQDNNSKLILMIIKFKDYRLTKFIELGQFSEKNEDISSILKDIIIYTLLSGNSFFILSDAVSTKVCLLPIHQKETPIWTRAGNWTTLNPSVKSHHINNSTPYDNNHLALKGLFALLLFDGIQQQFHLIDLKEYPEYLKFNDAKNMNEQSEDWKHFFREFLLNALKGLNQTSTSSNSGIDRTVDALNDPKDEDFESYRNFKRPRIGKKSTPLQKRMKKADSVIETDSSESRFVNLKNPLCFKGLDDKLIISEMSTYSSVKFVIPSKAFLEFLDKLQSESDEDILRKQIIQQGTDKIFWKFYDLQGNITRLYIYGYNYFGDYVTTGLSEADRYIRGSMGDFDSLESINAIAKADYDNEVETLRGIYRHNATLKRNEKDFIINTTQAYCHGEVLANTMEGRIYQGYHIAYNYIDFVANKPKTKSQFKLWKTQIDNLHKAGYHHGDIHPRNVACRDDGEVFIYDFGKSEPISEMEGYWKQKCLNKTCTDYKELKRHSRKKPVS
ncbi:hypothetical protein BN7_5411 [Wickerhamomyces ciferrii]|uniref:Protein kinase domain-containing protein n=1 Tax=Wickerhamomyces ciferrii (strain ATCC 14091 / BCRC 22168 / CBS 111 / JCM 3599 / NBRC 0793 / NRRL Y-1031 F-60-10) TaxID=1206466 RepID=K0KKU5_WICCF|nr:uncharacterized protein BN7_5411 [Wickerhamomyces ciferrii]CCH45825.1 hypothetical protein BN7_5411 [Wickerhamomyces ciferrii]